jgi:hypothetical protein
LLFFQKKKKKEKKKIVWGPKPAQATPMTGTAAPTIARRTALSIGLPPPRAALFVRELEAAPPAGRARVTVRHRSRGGGLGGAGRPEPLAAVVEIIHVRVHL